MHPILKNAIDTGLMSAPDLKKIMDEGVEDIVICDATYALPGSNMQPYDAYLTRRIDGAVYFDIDDIADPESPMPHMLPSPAIFAEKVGALGIGNEDVVIVYDQSGTYMASTRAWWMLRAMGHDNVCVLDGGMMAWLAEGYPTTGGEPDILPEQDFTATLNKDLVQGTDDLLGNLQTKQRVVLDARTADRFAGGHIPGSFNLPFPVMIDPETRRLKEKESIREVFESLPEENTPITVSCGSGVTACTLALALHSIGLKNIGIYDGSWTEWTLPGTANPIER